MAQFKASFGLSKLKICGKKRSNAKIKRLKKVSLIPTEGDKAEQSQQKKKKYYPVAAP